MSGEELYFLMVIQLTKNAFAIPKMSSLQKYAGMTFIAAFVCFAIYPYAMSVGDTRAVLRTSRKLWRMIIS